jgi:hypothetical protein
MEVSMVPNSRQLAMRDPAIAALVGIIAMGGNNFGSDFGDVEGDFGDDISGDFGGDEFAGDIQYGFDMFGDFGADAAAPIPAKPTAQQAVAAWRAQRAQAMASRRRQNILHPNKGAREKVERYTFSLSQAITLGTPIAPMTMTGNPDVDIRPQVLTINVPSPMFMFITEMSVANVKVTVGGGSVEDAWNYNALGVGRTLDMPTITPAQRALILGSYSGYVPPGFAAGAFLSQLYITASFKGPASVVT